MDKSTNTWSGRRGSQGCWWLCWRRQFFPSCWTTAPSKSLAPPPWCYSPKNDNNFNIMKIFMVLLELTMAPSKSPASPHYSYSPKMGLSKHEKVVCWKFVTICKPSSTLKSRKRKEKHFFSSKQPVVVPPQDRSSRRTHCSCQPCRATSRAEESGASTSSYLSLSLQIVMAQCLSYWQSAKHFCLFYLKAKPWGDWRRVKGSTIWKKCTGRLEDWRKVLFGREVQADRQTKDPSGHRRSDFWEVSTSSIVNRREPGGILLKNSQIWNNLFGIKIKTSSWVFCCGNSYSSR